LTESALFFQKIAKLYYDLSTVSYTSTNSFHDNAEYVSVKLHTTA